MNALTVFLDVGGTLLDTPDIFEIVTRRLVGKWPDIRTSELILETYEGMIRTIRYEDDQYPFQNIVHVHAAALALLAEKHGYKNISNQARRICVDTYACKSVLFRETIPVLETLLRHDVRMIIASDNDREILDVQLTKHDLGKYFLDICISEDVRVYKPAPGFVNYLEKYASSNENYCYFVGDAKQDVESGNRLGIKSVLLDRRNTKGNMNADYVIHDLSELLPILGLK